MVKRVECARDLADDRERTVKRPRPGGLKMRLKSLSSQPFHGEARDHFARAARQIRFPMFQQVVYPAQVRVSDFPGDSDLALKAFESFTIERPLAPHGL